MKSRSLGTVFALFTIALLIAAPAYAYVDPGTGGMLIQLASGGAAGLAVLIRLYWGRVKKTWGKRPQFDSVAGQQHRRGEPPRHE
jgi:hypothetical protein